MPEPHWRGPPWAGGAGRGPGGRFFRRAIGFFVGLIILGPLLGVGLASAFGLITGPHRWLVAGITVLVMVTIGLVLRRTFGRSLAPVGELIHATERVGAGETGVRIEVGRPGPFAAVGGSFNKMAARLEEEDERRRRLLADLSHELRTPLTVVRGEIEAVIDGVHDASRLSDVIDQVGLMERLLEDLRVLALTEAGRLVLHPEPTSPRRLIEDVVGSFRTPMEAQGVVAEITFRPPDYETILDPTRIHQVLSNLVSNAIRQMPGGGTLTMSGVGTQTELRITVGDTGGGIPPELLETMFDRFTRSGDSAGSGLGLSIARDLVEAHGGELTAANGLEGGAVFEMRLPAVTR